MDLDGKSLACCFICMIICVFVSVYEILSEYLVTAFLVQ